MKSEKFKMENEELKSENEFVKVKLGDVATVYNGSTPDTKQKEYFDGDIIWITPKDISEQKTKYITQGERNISLKGYQSCSTTMVPKGTVLLTSRAPIGLVAIADTELCTNQGFKNIVTDEEKLHNEYLYYILKISTEFLNSLGSGTTFNEISSNVLKNINFKIHKSVETQKKIARVLSVIDEKIEVNKKINEKLEEMARDLYEYYFVQFDFPNENGEP
ncbi:restriction endonuclease subunit S, partial [Caminibacter pacificus]